MTRTSKLVLRCRIIPKPAQISKGQTPCFLFDNFPILRSLIPVSTKPRRAYAEALERELDDGYELYEVLKAAYIFSEKYGKKLPFATLEIYFNRPVAQALLLGLQDFLEKFVPVYVEEFSHDTINSKGSEWISTSVEIDPL